MFDGIYRSTPSKLGRTEQQPKKKCGGGTGCDKVAVGTIYCWCGSGGGSRARGVGQKCGPNPIVGAAATTATCWMPSNLHECHLVNTPNVNKTLFKLHFKQVTLSLQLKSSDGAFVRRQW